MFESVNILDCRQDGIVHAINHVPEGGWWVTCLDALDAIVLFHISCVVPRVNFAVVLDVSQSFVELFARHTRDVVASAQRHVLLH